MGRQQGQPCMERRQAGSHAPTTALPLTWRVLGPAWRAGHRWRPLPMTPAHCRRVALHRGWEGGWGCGRGREQQRSSCRGGNAGLCAGNRSARLLLPLTHNPKGAPRKLALQAMLPSVRPLPSSAAATSTEVGWDSESQCAPPTYVGQVQWGRVVAALCTSHNSKAPLLWQAPQSSLVRHSTALTPRSAHLANPHTLLLRCRTLCLLLRRPQQEAALDERAAVLARFCRLLLQARCGGIQF